MKKIIALLLAVVMVFALAACAAKTEAPAAEAPKAEEKKEEAPKAEEKKEEAPAAEEAPAVEEAPAATWPNGPVTILEGNAVGSLNDVNVHTIADWITKQTGADVTITADDVGGGANLAVDLVNAEPDGQTLMLIGMNCISNYYNGTWAVNPCDSSKFKLVCGFLQPLPDSGCMILTQADSPYSTWEELAAYAEEHPGEITVASISGKIMDIKMKAIFNGTGVAKNIRWVSTTNADASANLLGGIINCVMFDETTALGYLADGSCKAIINCRADNDFSYYDQSMEGLDVMKSVPTLLDVFGADAEKYMVPNRSMLVAPADTPDEICAQIAAVIDAIDNETEGEFYDRCRANGGTSKYYTWPGDEVQAEWGRLDPIIKEIVEMG